MAVVRFQAGLSPETQHGVLAGGALVLGEVIHWQDWAAVVLMVVSIAAVLLPRRA